jgi:hypothetical protein
MRLVVAFASLLFPILGIACESVDQRTCKKQLASLVSYRSEAISTAFGNMMAVLPEEIDVKFVASKDPEFSRYGGRVAYDRETHSILIPRRFFAAKLPNPLRSAVYYWPFYQNEMYHNAFPLIEAIDNALWGAYLQESAQARGLSWPHKECASVEVGKRLPCEMLVQGIAENLTGQRAPIFNSNRLDRIWPEDFAAFAKRVWLDDAEYTEVQHYGGILLVQPLINEFGIRNTLAYVAQTPFTVDGNMRASATQYQNRAREVLGLARQDEARATATAQNVSWTPATPAYSTAGKIVTTALRAQ